MIHYWQIIYHRHANFAQSNILDILDWMGFRDEGDCPDHSQIKMELRAHNIDDDTGRKQTILEDYDQFSSTLWLTGGRLRLIFIHIMLLTGGRLQPKLIQTMAHRWKIHADGEQTVSWMKVEISQFLRQVMYFYHNDSYIHVVWDGYSRLR